MLADERLVLPTMDVTLDLTQIAHGKRPLLMFSGGRRRCPRVAHTSRRFLSGCMRPSALLPQPAHASIIGPYFAYVPIENAAMRKLQYLVRINKDPDSDWGASVPDLPGCVATGKTIDQALRRIEGAIALHIRGMVQDGLAPPQPKQRAVKPTRTTRGIDFFATIEVAA